jgi:hypothetical protein
MLTPLKLAIAGFAIVAALGAFAAYRQSLINHGWDKALQKVEQQNDRAREAASRVQRTVDECYDAHRVWDVIAGACND